MASWDFASPVPDNPEQSYFTDQVSHQTTTRGRKKQITHYLSIDSRYRRSENTISSRYVTTDGNFLQPTPEGLTIKITNPNQLHTRNQDDASGCPESIHLLLAWTNPTRSNNPTSINGISSQELIYRPADGGPTWYATLVGYDEDTDQASYSINGLPDQTRERGLAEELPGSDTLQVRQILEMRHGFQRSSHYLISLKNPIRHIVSARLVSSEFPLPHHLPKILARTSYC